MIFKMINRKHLYQLILISIILIVIITPVQAGDNFYTKPRHLEDLAKGWQYCWEVSPINNLGLPSLIFDTKPESGVWKPLSVPGQPRNDQNAKSIWLRVKLPKSELEEPGILFATNDQWFEVYFDGRLIYQYGKTRVKKERAPGSPWHFIPLPANYQNKYLFIRMDSFFPRMTGMVRIAKLGSHSLAQTWIIHRSIDSFILGCLFLFLGLSLIIIFTGAKRSQKSFLALGTSSFCAGLWLISETNMRQVLFDIPIYCWTYLAIGSFYLMPAGLCAFVEQIFGGSRCRLILRRLWQINIVFAVTTFILDLFMVIPLTSTLSIFYMFLFILIILLVSVTLYEAIKGNQEARMFGMGIFILALTGIYDILGWYYRVVPWVRYTSHWGLFLFYSLLFFILRKQYLDMYMKLRNYSNEIEKKNKALHQMWLEVKESRDEIANWNRKLEERVIERTEQLAEANNELVLMLETLKRTQTQLIQSEKMSALGNLVAGVAHEINTPIGISVTAVSHLAEKTTELTKSFHSNQITRSELEKYLELGREMSSIILINLERAANLIRSFKQLAVDQSSEVKRVFNVQAYIKEVLLSLQPKLKKTKHQIKIDCPDDLEIKSYPGALSQIITNLIMNSLIHAFSEDESGLITFTVIRDQSTINFSYSDNGKGITRESLGKIFNPFFTTMRGKGGTGLGLHIVYNIVTQTLHGTINCQSQQNNGTTFNISFPA